MSTPLREEPEIRRAGPADADAETADAHAVPAARDTSAEAVHTRDTLPAPGSVLQDDEDPTTERSPRMTKLNVA